MSCYFVAQITIHDRDAYGLYEDGFDEVLGKFNGTVIAVDDHPVLLEGEWNHGRIVLIRFPSKEEARRWYDSPEYRRLAEHRFRASEATTMLVEARE